MPTSLSTKLTLKSIYNSIQSDLSDANRILDNTLTASNYPILRNIGSYVSQVKGKQVRAALVILLAQNKTPHIHTYAAGIECIHLASLIHDDIIDNADTRRNQPTLYKKYGTNTALVSGVYIYAQALKLITSLNNQEILTHISDTVAMLCEGELFQFSERHTFMTPEQYLQMITEKTAALFMSACYGGALLGGATPDQAKAAETFGKALGIIFQLTDDYLDLFGTQKDLNKTPGQDLLEGDFTLPLIYLLETLPESDQKTVLDKIKAKDKTILTDIQTMDTSRIQERMNHTIQEYYELGIESLKKLPENTKELQAILDIVRNR